MATMTEEERSTPDRTDREPLRIAHVIFGLGVGGLETGIINLLRALGSGEFEQRIYCMKDLGPNAQKARALGAGVDLVGNLHSRNRLIIFKLARHFRRFRPHIVHSRNFGSLDAVIAARLARVPRVVHGEHGWDTFDPEGTSRKRRFIRGCLSPLVDRYITVSRHLGDWLQGHRGWFGGKVVTIHNGVDTERFFPPARVRGLGAEALVLGTAGRFVPIKDQAGLIEAFSRLAAEYPKARLRIVGDGPLMPDLKGRAQTAGLADRIEFPGPSDRMENEYASIDVFVLPSLNEGISNTILEAMASGLPVVATRVGGNPELVEDGVTGRLVPKEDPAALATALREYLVDPGRIALHGRAGRERALAKFSIPAMAAAYREVYRSLDPRR